MVPGLHDPMQLADICVALRRQVTEKGYSIEISTDFRAFNEMRNRCRGGKVAPFFDPAVNTGLDTRAFWMAASDAGGTPVCVQAFRLDSADPNLADWAPGWIMGLYLRRGELLVPRSVSPPTRSVSERVSGPVVYHGELWIDSKARARGLLELVPRLGIFLAMIKWHPQAVWAIIGQSMATRGLITRLGYAHLERGFLQWEFLPEGGDEIEWLAVTERDALEYLVQETALAPSGADSPRK